MLRSVLSTVAPTARSAANNNRSLATAAARRAPIAIGGIGRSSQGVQPLSLDRCTASTPCSSATTASRAVLARGRCSWRGMSSASAKVASSAGGGGDSAAAAAAAAADTQGEEAGDEGGVGSGKDARDPATGEGIWMDEEDEPLELEKPKKVQKFCGKVVSDNMDKTIKVAVPYWYFVKGLGRKIIRYSKIMAHDEDNSANVGDTVILVDCQRKSKRKKHTLFTIVRKLPRLDDF